jgi:hypothetical protein
MNAVATSRTFSGDALLCSSCSGSITSSSSIFLPLKHFARKILHKKFTSFSDNHYVFGFMVERLTNLTLVVKNFGCKKIWHRGRPRPLCVRASRSTPDDAPSPIKTPRREKPKDPITFPEHIAIRRRRQPEDREGPEALPGTLLERGIATGGLLHRHACLWCDEW